MSNRPFYPIRDPLSMQPIDFVNEARRRGFDFVQGRSFNEARNCGCYLGIACRLKTPDTDIWLADEAGNHLGLSRLATSAVIDGFDEHDENPTYEEHEEYTKWYAKGRAVARAAGLEVHR